MAPGGIQAFLSTAQQLSQQVQRAVPVADDCWLLIVAAIGDKWLPPQGDFQNALMFRQAEKKTKQKQIKKQREKSW